MRNLRSSLILLAVFIAGPAFGADDAGGVEAFEKAVRPLFAEHCIECHGAKKQSAGLRLDTVAGIRTGADDGPVIVAGKPKESRLIKAVRHEGDSAMPPKKKLPAESIDLLTAWVERGAPMPKTDAAAVAKVDPKKHWAFQPVKAVAVPNFEIKDRASNEIDRFIGVKLKEKGLSFAPQADPRTLIRRVYYDLIGLPPTADEVDAFAKDPSQQAYERIVEKLLASPQYGERWGRHWLDVARYADTKGYVFTDDRNYTFAYSYRDYVIQSLNADKPFNHFVVEQLAADKLDLGNDNRALAGLGFLTVGRRFNNDTNDIIDDRIEVVARGLLGLSVGCARCHDHKFDPIPIGDYYSLYGVFQSSVEPKELPILTGQPRTKQMDEFDAEYARLDAIANNFYEKTQQDALAKHRTAKLTAEYMLAWRDLRGPASSKYDQYIKDNNLSRVVLDRWRRTLYDEPKSKTDPVFIAWEALVDVKPGDFAATVHRLRDDPRVHPAISSILRDASPSSVEDLAYLYGEVLVAAWREKSPSASTKLLAEAFLAATSPEKRDVETLIPIAIKNQYRKLRAAADKYRDTSPYAATRAMVLNDAPKPSEPVVFLRGNPANRGPKVPRQFLQVLSSGERKPFVNGSGRLDLANAVVAPENPLTARVIVNRFWAWHFGQGLVRTPSDFGVRSDPPTHPELLDWLADQFVHGDGWSLKKLHRRIVLSATYRQSSAISEKALAADPENALLSRSPRRRLEFEPLRDSLLAASGTLDLSTVGGRSEDIFKQPFSHRRTVYAFIDRQNLPGTLRSFDLANPDQHSPQRYRTAVPQQALFLMNSPFVAEIAKKTMARPEIAAAKDDASRVQAVFRDVYGRNATKPELALALEYIGKAPAASAGKLGPWEQLVQALVMSNEFAFVD